MEGETVVNHILNQIKAMTCRCVRAAAKQKQPHVYIGAQYEYDIKITPLEKQSVTCNLSNLLATIHACLAARILRLNRYLRSI